MKTQFKSTITALCAGALSAAALTVPTGLTAGTASADPRVTPTGCTQIGTSTAVRCTVHSASMDRDIPVLVRPSLTAGERDVATFLDGANNNGSNGWLSTIRVHEELADRDATLVFPVMDPWTWTQDFDTREAVRYDTFISQELPDYLESAFSIPDGGRGTTGIAGLSSGAYGAMNLASKYPEQYNAVWAMSGLYDPAKPIQRSVVDVSARGRSEHAASPWDSRESVAENNPTVNLDNLTMPVLVNAASGVPNVTNLGPDPLAVLTEGAVFEFGSMVFTRELEAKTRLKGMDNFHYRYDILGAHDWDTWIRAALADEGAQRFMDSMDGKDAGGSGSGSGSGTGSGTGSGGSGGAGGSSVSSGPGASS